MVKNLELTTGQVGEAIGTCPTAASRQVQAAEDLLDLCIREAARLSRSQRPDRLHTLIVQRLRTVVSLVAKHPDQLAPWISRIMLAQQGRQPRKAVR